MAIQLSTAASNALMGDGSNQGLKAFAGTNCYFIFYTGTQVVGGPEGTPPSGALNTTGAGNAVTVTSWSESGGVLTAAGFGTAGTANAAGTAASWVLYTSGAAAIASGTVGTSGADINLSSVSFSVSGTITLTAFSLTYSAH